MPEFQASIPRHARVRLDPPGQKQEEYTFRCSHRRQRPHLQFLAGLETPCWSRVRDPTYRCNPDRSSASLAVCIACKGRGALGSPNPRTNHKRGIEATNAYEWAVRTRGWRVSKSGGTVGGIS